MLRTLHLPLLHPVGRDDQDLELEQLNRLNEFVQPCLPMQPDHVPVLQGRLVLNQFQLQGFGQSSVVQLLLLRDQPVVQPMPDFQQAVVVQQLVLLLIDSGPVVPEQRAAFVHQVADQLVVQDQQPFVPAFQVEQQCLVLALEEHQP